MATPVHGKDGRFVDNIGEGKLRVPTPATLPRRSPTSASPAGAGSQDRSVEAASERFRALMPRDGDEVAAARQVEERRAVATPGTLPRVRRTEAAPSRGRVTPGGWVLTEHARRQAELKKVPLDVLVAAVDDPQTTYESGRYPGQQRRIRGDVCAVVDPESRHVITLYRNVEETDLRDDQRRDGDALAYERRRRR